MVCCSLAEPFGVVAYLAILVFTLIEPARERRPRLTAPLVFFLVTSKSKGKAVAMLMALVLLAAATLAISEPLRTRYLTLFSADVSEEASQQTSQMSQTAAASAESRRELLQESLLRAHPCWA